MDNNRLNDQSKQYPFIFITAALLLTALVYWQGLNGSYLFDDTINIIDNKKLHVTEFNLNHVITAALSSDSGPLKRPVSMLSFALNHLMTGLDPYYLKLTNLLIHLLNGLSLYLLSSLLLHAYRQRFQPDLTDPHIRWVALAVSAAWLLHPFNLTGVLYIVQRMTSLASLFTIWGLISYVYGRLRLNRGQSGIGCILTGLILFGGLAAFSKETGLLLVVFIFITEWALFGFQAPDRQSRAFVITVNAVCAVAPVVIALSYFGLHIDGLIASYGSRDFTLVERVLTEGRVLWFYMQMILLPDITQMGLFHDDLTLSTGWLQPLMTLPAMLGLVSLLAAALFARKRAPLLSFGILFFLAGHSLESTVFALEITHEHRNYLPSYGLLLIVFYYLLHPSLLQRTSKWFLPAISASVIGLLTVNTAVRAGYWSNNLELALVNVRHHPMSARSAMHAGRMFFDLGRYHVNEKNNPQAAKKFYEQARGYFEQSTRNSDYNLSGYYALLVLDDRERKPINPQLVEQLADKLETGLLSAANENALVTLNRCQQEGSCQLPAPVMNRLFRAILNNPGLAGKSKAIILTEATQHVVSHGDLEAATYFARQAVHWFPEDAQIRLNLAHILIARGFFEQAHEQIKAAKQLDPRNYVAKKIRRQEQLLAQAQRS